MCKTASPLVNSTHIRTTNTGGMINTWWLFTTFKGPNGDTQHHVAHPAIYTWVVTFLVIWLLCLLCSCLYLCRGSLQQALTGVMICLTGELAARPVKAVPIAQMVNPQAEEAQMVTHIPERPQEDKN